SAPSSRVGQERSRSSSGPGSGSSASTTIALITPAYSEATPAAVDGRPIASMNFSVGPLTARPATYGLTAITGAAGAAIASRMPGTERMGPIEITGFEGPIT